MAVPDSLPVVDVTDYISCKTKPSSMKKHWIYGTVLAVLGLLIALGPRFLFKVCTPGCSCCGDIPQCHWTAQAEIGMGFLISALGFCFFVFSDPKIHLGLFIGVFLASIVSLLIPVSLIGGCQELTMTCNRIAIPALVIENVILMAFSLFMIIMLARKISTVE